MINSLLFLVLLICVITDLKSQKIYNIVILPFLILALLFNTFIFGWSGLASSLLGFIVGLAILLIPYLMGGIGAGDVKLLAVIGALKGTGFVLTTAVYMALVGGVIGIVVLLFRKGIVSRLKSIIYSVCGIRYGIKLPIVSEGLTTTYPYGVAIAGGALLASLANGVVLL